MGQFDFTSDITGPIKLHDHRKRHEDGGVDEISLTGLSGEPADTVNKSLFDADTFLYASSDNTPLATTPANVLVALSGHAGATFDWNSQALTGIAALTMNGTLSGVSGLDATTETAIEAAIDTLANLTSIQGHTFTLGSDFNSAYMIDAPLSPMIISGGIISEGTTGTVTISALTALLRSGTSATDPLVYVTLAEQANQTMDAANTKYQIGLDYNSGSPQILIQEANFNRTTQIGLGTCMKDDSDNVHFQNAGMRLQDGVAKLQRRAASLRATELSTGCTISDEGGGSRQFHIAPGIVYHGIHRLTPFSGGAFDSGTDKFTYIYGDTDTGWTYTADSTVINNTQYWHPTNHALATLTTNKYGCHWVYLHPDEEHVFVLMGTTDTKLAEAELTPAPADTPIEISDFSVLLGRIIIKKDDTAFTTIQMVTDYFFSGTAVADHGALEGLADDDHTQYLLADGTRALSGAWDMGSQNLTNVNIDSGTIDGFSWASIAKGDILYADATPVVARLAIGADNYLLSVASDVPAWLSPASVLADISPLTTRGDIMFRNATVSTRLAKGAENTVLVMGADEPAWSATLAGLILTSPAINGTITTTGLTMPAFTLDGTVTVASQIFDIGSGRFTISSTSGATLYLETTYASSPHRVHIRHLSASPADNDYQAIRFTSHNDNATPEEIDFGELIVKSIDVSDGVEDALFQTYLMNAGAWNKAWTCTGAGLAWFDVGVNVDNYYQVGGTQVVAAQGAAVANAAEDLGEVTTQLNLLLARCRAHGLIAT